MAQYKVIATVTWKIEDDFTEEECLKYAKNQIEEIMESKPQGEDFEGFDIQVDVVKMKSKMRIMHIEEFDFDEVFPYITEEDEKKEYIVDGKSYHVRMNSDRYLVFRNNPNCVACGLKGTKLVLGMNPGDKSPHFNLYAEENGRLVLMTKDHIKPKSVGGENKLNNYQTMCSWCNNLKGSATLSLSDVKELREMWNNDEKLPKKELRSLINKRRSEMHESNKG